MISDYLSCSKFCCFRKWNLIIKPRRFYKTFLSVFQITARTGNHKANTVNQTYFYFHIFHRKFCRFFWNKLRLGCHNHFPCSTLRKFIHRSLAFILIFYFRKYHKTFNKCWFATSDRPNNAKVNLSACSGWNILIYILFFHENPSPILFQYMRRIRKID